MIEKRVIEHRSFNGAPWGRMEPSGKAEMVEWRRERWRGESRRGPQPCFGWAEVDSSSPRQLKMWERSELLQLDFQGYPLFKQVLKKTHYKHSPEARESERNHLGARPTYLQLLLQFTVKSCQHCVCLLVPSDWSLNRLLILSEWPEYKQIQFLLSRQTLKKSLMLSCNPDNYVFYLGMEGCVARTAAMTFDFWGPCCSSSGRSSSSDFNLRRTGFGGGASGPDEPLVWWEKESRRISTIGWIRLRALKTKYTFSCVSFHWRLSSIRVEFQHHFQKTLTYRVDSSWGSLVCLALTLDCS